MLSLCYIPCSLILIVHVLGRDEKEGIRNKQCQTSNKAKQQHTQHVCEQYLPRMQAATGLNTTHAKKLVFHWLHWVYAFALL